MRCEVCVGVSCVHSTPKSDKRGHRTGYQVPPSRVSVVFRRACALHCSLSFPNMGSLYACYEGTEPAWGARLRKPL